MLLQFFLELFKFFVLNLCMEIMNGIHIKLLKMYIDINSKISPHHSIEEAFLFLNYFVSSLYHEYLMS